MALGPLGGGFPWGPQALGTWASVVAAHGLWSPSSIFVAHRLSVSEACGIFTDQGSNPYPLHWYVGSYPFVQPGKSSTVLSYEY